MFVACRVGEIQENTNVKQWHWVPSDQNVADLATKEVKDLDLNTRSKWFLGPAFLKRANEYWPSEPKCEIEDCCLLIDVIQDNQLELPDYFIGYKFSMEYIGFHFEHIANFMQYLTFCSQIPSVTFMWLNIFVRIGGSIPIRMVWGIGVSIVVFLITIILAIADTSGSPYFFFYLTMICVAVLNSASAVYQSTILGMAAKLPEKYTGALILGNNISGTFASIVSILSKLITSNLKKAAIYYFTTALVILSMCFSTHFLLQRNNYYKFYISKENTAISNKEIPPYWDIFKRVFPQFANVFMLFFVTLAVFPAIQVGIEKSDPNFFISDEFYIDIMCFLCFNIFAMLGSWLPSVRIWPEPQWLWVPMALRFLYIPLLLLCNYQVRGKRRRMPILIKNDWVYFIIASTMALTSGYFSSLAMMYAPRTVEEQHAPFAGMFAGAGLLTGIFIGILISFLWPWLISV